RKPEQESQGLNAVASARRELSARGQRKRLCKAQTDNEIYISLTEQRDKEHERVLFMENGSKEPLAAFYRDTEKAQGTTCVWG
ncbi:MAG: hypothetical protein LQ343_008015, partial [Gyalolechia ehrenbergii]